MTSSSPQIDVYVLEQFLYDMDKDKNNLIKGKIIGVSSYEGEQVTFQVLLETGALFSYLPIHAFCMDTISTIVNVDQQQTFNLCKSGRIDVFTLDYFNNKIISIFNKKSKWEGFGEYILSIDWVDSNEQLHLIKHSGLLWLRPNHKILIFDNKDDPKKYKTLPSYKKLHQEWKEI